MTTTQYSAHDAGDAAQATRKPRQLILGCDGTNNTLTGGVHDTNVLKIIGQLVPESDNRLIYYDPGVGAPDQVPPLGLLNAARRKWERIAGLANGRGIYENIAEAYMFLVEHYRQGDQIYLFGFSRGAFTARSVAGMVELFGIIRTDSKSLILTLTRVYFSTPGDSASGTWGWQKRFANRAEKLSKENKTVADNVDNWSPTTPDDEIRDYLVKTKARRSTREEVAKQIREQFASVEGAQAVIHFIGVWDTVESVGIPGLQRTITSNGDARSKEHIRHVRHAISMDEHRATFAPRLYWDEDYDTASTEPGNPRSLKQRWFRGVHSDVGGGYGTMEAGLSDQAFTWMLDEAIACDLTIEKSVARPAPLAKPLIAHDACFETPWWGVAGLTVRRNVTHRKDGLDQHIAVLTGGAGSGPNPRIYSVWSAISKRRVAQAGLMLAFAAILFCLYGWLASLAISGSDDASVWERIGHGVAALEMWQKSYFLNGYTTRAIGPALDAVRPAALAMLVDFGFILAYSWLIGLFASWAFNGVVGHRNPADKVPRMARLGRAPMFLVLADVLENLLTLVTLGCIYYTFNRASYVFGAAMMIVGAVKWACLLDTLALLVVGLAKKIPAFSMPWRTSAPGKRRGT